MEEGSSYTTKNVYILTRIDICTNMDWLVLYTILPPKLWTYKMTIHYHGISHSIASD